MEATSSEDATWNATNDHFMVERDARALRRRHIRALMRTYLRRAKARIGQSLKHAGAQPIRPERTAA